MAVSVTVLTILVGVSIAFAIIELGLTARLVDLGGSNSSRINFMLFNSIWSILVLLYVGLTPFFYDRIFHRLAAFALEVVTMIFWFAGSIALAVVIPAGASCFGNVCGTIRAATAFGFFLWALFVALCAFDGLEVARSRRDSGPKPPAAVGV